MLSLTLVDRDVKIIYELNAIKPYRGLSFDKRRLQQVLYNLLTNAIKFTRQGMITVYGKYSRTEHMVEISVTDEGIGMSQDEANRVFEGSLKTGNDESKKLNPYSNGIGLSICKQLCESLDGEISC